MEEELVSQGRVVVENMSSESIVNWFSLILEKYVIPFGVRILIALVVYLIGRWIIKKLNNLVCKGMNRSKTDASLTGFIKSLVSILLNFILIVAIISVLGIDTTSLVALLASAGLAIGMALSGTLQNFAGGVMILLFKPFRIGDFIEGSGQCGIVKEIQIFNTIIVTPDNKTIVVPNGGLSTSILVNYSTQDKRRVDWTFSITYGDDVDKAKQVLLRLCDSDPRILKDPAVFADLLKLNESSVDIVLRAWVNSADYWDVFFSINNLVYKTFGSEGLHFPYRKLDVNIMQQNQL